MPRSLTRQVAESHFKLLNCVKWGNIDSQSQMNFLLLVTWTAAITWVMAELHGLQAVYHPVLPDDKLSIQDLANWTFVQQNYILFSAVHIKKVSFSLGNQSWSKHIISLKQQKKHPRLKQRSNEKSFREQKGRVHKHVHPNKLWAAKSVLNVGVPGLETVHALKTTHTLL